MEVKAPRRLIFVLSTALLTGCPRSPEQPAWPESKFNPGLTLKPAGRILGEKNTDLAEENAVPLTSALPQGEVVKDTTSLEKQYITAADEGQVWAQTRLGVLYARTENDPLRWEKAVRLLQLAAGQGDGEAQYELAVMAATGRGMPASDAEAFTYICRPRMRKLLLT